VGWRGRIGAAGPGGTPLGGTRDRSTQKILKYSSERIAKQVFRKA